MTPQRKIWAGTAGMLALLFLVVSNLTYRSNPEHTFICDGTECMSNGSFFGLSLLVSIAIWVILLIVIVFATPDPDQDDD